MRDMEIKKVLEHTCFQKNDPLSPKRCRCRHYISVDDAAKLIAGGVAQYIIKSYRDACVEEACPVCGDQDKLRNSCAYCGRTGKLKINRKIPVYGEDIITSVGQKGRKLENTIAKKTPRSPTIESNHILRSVGIINGAAAARERIEEYQTLTLKERIRLLTRIPDVKEFDILWNSWIGDVSLPFPMAVHQEPEDNPAKGTGRSYDYGRSV